MQAKSRPPVDGKTAADLGEQHGLWKGQNSQLSDKTQFGGEELSASRNGKQSTASCNDLRTFVVDGFVHNHQMLSRFSVNHA